MDEFEQVVGILRPTLAVGKPVQGLGHPKGALAARSALSATLVRIKFGDVRQGLDDVRRIVEHNNRARA